MRGGEQLMVIITTTTIMTMSMTSITMHITTVDTPCQTMMSKRGNAKITRLPTEAQQTTTTATTTTTIVTSTTLRITASHLIPPLRETRPRLLYLKWSCNTSISSASDQ